jgi:hypothetical protein
LFNYQTLNLLQFVIAAVLAVAAATSYPSNYAPSSYNKDNKYAGITIVSQSDERNLDGSSKWR